MESDYAYTGIVDKLNISIESLYKNNEHILSQIEEGINNGGISSPVVGYQGVPGAYGEQAAYTYFKGKWQKLIAHDAFEDVIEALEDGSIDYGVLPIENSSAGEILDTYDFMKSKDIYIVGEQAIRIQHNLLGVKGACIDEIEEVYSHQQGLSQSKTFIKQYPNMKPCPYINTATACQHVAKLGDKTKAAIGSKRAGELYGLEVLASDIQFNKNNYTRFVILAKKMQIANEHNKISILFSTQHVSGSLYNILGHFAYNGLNLLKIQSRPMLEKKWEYYFFADLEGNLLDVNVLVALSKIIDQCSSFKILGNYLQSEE